MKKQISCAAAAAVVSALCCAPAWAATKISTVTNDSSATNGCTLRSVAGYGGYGFNAVVWGVDCPNDPEVTVERRDYSNEWGWYWCEMANPSSGYSVTGNCGNYSLWRN
jgi:hypothetical protein